MFKRLFGIKPAPKPRKRKVRQPKKPKAVVRRPIKRKPTRKRGVKLKVAPKRAAPKIVVPIRKGDGVKALFEPRGVAIVGASGAKAGTAPALFRSVVDNMSHTYKGKTYIVDLSGKMEGAFKDVKEVRGKAELAVLALPQDLALKNVKKVVDAGVRAMVVSPRYGQEQRGELLGAKKQGVRILGPNSAMGVINTRTGLCTSLREIMPKQGEIAIVSQSNSVGAAVLDSARLHGIGVSKFVSLGDKMDVDEADLIKYFSDDNTTRVICVGIGDIRDGRKFVDALRAATEKKPVVVLRAGIARLEDKIYDAAFKQARAIRVRDVEEMLDAANALAKQPPMAGDKIAIISNAHGPAVLAVDAMYREGLILAKLGEKTAKVIAQRYPDIDVANPIELSMEAKAKQYEFVLKNVLADPNVDGVMVINMLKSSLLEIDDVRAIAEVLKKFKKPVVDVVMGGESYALVRDALKDTNVPTCDSPERAVRALKALWKYGQVKEKIKPPVVSKAAKKR
jgi:acyl-CoA synthetase (NDP forming)